MKLLKILQNQSVQFIKENEYNSLTEMDQLKIQTIRCFFCKGVLEKLEERKLEYHLSCKEAMDEAKEEIL